MPTAHPYRSKPSGTLSHGYCRDVGGRSAVYRIWSAMKDRCTNPNNPMYPSYGMCRRWKDFVNFLRDVGDRPDDTHILWCADPTRGYRPGNVMWMPTGRRAGPSPESMRLAWQKRRLKWPHSNGRTAKACGGQRGQLGHGRCVSPNGVDRSCGFNSLAEPTGTRRRKRNRAAYSTATSS
jgi:hypothetical protein